MKSFKTYLSEAAPTPSLPPTDTSGLISRDIDPKMSAAVFDTAVPMSTAKGYISGVANPNTLPYGNPGSSPYKSYGAFTTGLDPGAQSNDGYINGGGGFKIQKASRDYMIALAKLYGVDIDTPEKKQQEQQQQAKQSQQQGQQQPQTDHYLINQIKKHPAMYLLNQDENLQKELDKGYKAMSDWKTTESNPDAGKDWYTIWKDKQQKDQDQHKMNLGRMLTLSSFRERSTEIHNRLKHHRLVSDKLPHAKNYLDPQNHQQSQQQDVEYGNDDEYGFEYGDTE